jgi:hypothetical protein
VAPYRPGWSGGDLESVAVEEPVHEDRIEAAETIGDMAIATAVAVFFTQTAGLVLGAWARWAQRSTRSSW